MNYVLWLISEPGGSEPREISIQHLKFTPGLEGPNEDQPEAAISKDLLQHPTPSGAHLATEFDDVNKNQPISFPIADDNIGKLEPWR